MKKKIAIWEVGFFTLISLFSLIYILTKTDPYNANFLIIILFYLSFFVFIAGFLTSWRYFSERELTLKRGAIIAAVLTALLLLYKIWV